MFSKFQEPQGCQSVASLPVVMFHSLADTFCGLLEEQEKIYANFVEELPHVSYNGSFCEEWKKMNQRAIEGTKKQQMYK